jgi:hypothetical protein
MALKVQSLRDRQIHAIERVLNLNKEVADPASSSHEATANGLVPQSAILNENGEPWKVLVFDDMGRDIVSFSLSRTADVR